MKVLTRYLLRAHLGPFAFAFAALTGLMVINGAVAQLSLLYGKGVPGRVILEFLLLSLPPVVALTLPMSVLVAVVHTFGRMSAENELTALRASGVDLRRLLAPLILVAGLTSGGMVWFNDRVLSATNHRLSLLMVDLFQTSPLLALEEETLNPIATPQGATYLRAARIDAVSGRMRDVVLYDHREADATRTVYADSGVVSLDAAQTDLLLSLYDGHMRRLDFRRPVAFERIAFERYDLRMPGVSRRLERSTSGARHERSMSMAMMRAEIADLRGRAAADPAAADDLRARIRSYQVEIHKKYSIALATLIFVLVGVPLALRFPRGGIGVVIAVCLPIFSLYYLGLDGGETLGDAGYVSPALAIWAVNLLLGAAGLVALLRLGSERGTTR